jgi:arsenate reductase
MRRENVLVLCARNSARSQMAEAFLRKHAGDRFEIHSAGLDTAPIHPLAHRVMEEVSVPLEGHRPKSVREFLGKMTVHHLVVVCEQTERECPRLFPGALRRHFWPFPDPAASERPEEEKLAAFRDVRDGIEKRILEWIDELGPRPVPLTRSS